MNELLATALGLQQEAFLSEEDVLLALQARLETLLDKEPDSLWNLLYRLDIDETAVAKALSEGTNAPALIARLILDRQRVKWASRASQSSGKSRAEDRDLLL